MDLRSEQVNGICVLDISGDLDTMTAPVLQAKLEDELEQGRLFFILDLSETRYVSSMGLRVFLSHLKKLKSIEGQMMLSGCNQLISDVLKMSGFLAYFKLVETREEALQALLKRD